MKKPENVEDMAARFTAAATTPALTITRPETAATEAPQAKRKAGRPAKDSGKSVPVFLKVPAGLHAELAAEAIKRTKATGKGVTVQQIILARVEGGRA